MSIVYFDTEHAKTVHDNIIAISGGLEGNNDIGLLDSTLFHIQNDLYYPTFCDKLTHLVFSVAKSHAFSDGNKRSSIALGAFFLEINNYQSLIGYFIVEMENIVLWLVQGKVTKEFLKEIFDCMLTYGSLSEDIKLKMFEILSQDNSN